MKTRRFGGLFWSRNYLSWLIYGVGALVFMLLQMAPRFFPSVCGARPLPLILFVVCVALFGGARVGAVIGAFAGILWDVYSFRLFGFNALFLLIIGVTVGLLVEWLLRANFPSAMLLCTGAVLFYSLVEWFFCHVLFLEEQVWPLLYKVYLPNGVYTVLLAPAMYGLVLLLAQFVRRRTNG